MTLYLRLALLLILSPIVLLLINAVVSRLWIGRKGEEAPPQGPALISVAVGAVAICAAAWLAGLDRLAGDPLSLLCGFVYVLATYGGLSFCYLNVLNATETSLHIHILMLLSVTGPIPAAEIQRRYGAADLIAARVDRMIALGQLETRGEYVVLASRTVVMAGKIVNQCRKILGLPLRPA